VLAPLALLASSARASVTGNLELQSQTTQTVVGGGSTQTTMLMESLSLHYAGLPFGPEVAIATAGGSFANVSGWPGYASGAGFGGRVLSFDGSVGLLPRRAVPLRLYGRGTMQDDAQGALSTHAGPSALYGAAMNLEPGTLVPALRLDVSEGRSTRPAHARFSDVQRRATATSGGVVLGQRVTLGLRLEGDHVDGAGDLESRGLTLAAGSARHQTTLLATEVRRSFPGLTGITSDRLLSGQSDQRWSAAVSTQLSARVTEARAGPSSGRVGDARAGFAWAPDAFHRQLTLSGFASAGLTRLAATQDVAATGTSYGGGGRVGYSVPLGPVTGGLAVGAATDTCACGFGANGTTLTVDSTASVALLRSERGSGQADYTLVRAVAPLERGGDRLESHARGTGRLSVGYASSLSASLAWDDGIRELLDISAARAVSIHERAVSGSVGATTYLPGLSLGGELRHARGRVVGGGGAGFIAGGATQVRAVTSASATAAWSPHPSLGIQAQLLGAWAALGTAPLTTSYGANAALDWRLGQITVGLQYQALAVEIGRAPRSLQQSIRSFLSRPFEL
jgi:hypothetical protein